MMLAYQIIHQPVQYRLSTYKAHTQPTPTPGVALLLIPNQSMTDERYIRLHVESQIQRAVHPLPLIYEYILSQSHETQYPKASNLYVDNDPA